VFVSRPFESPPQHVEARHLKGALIYGDGFSITLYVRLRNLYSPDKSSESIHIALAPFAYRDENI